MSVINTATDKSLKKLNKKFNEANAANDNRLRGILSLYDQSDAQAIDDAKRAGAEEAGNELQTTISQGLGNTTRLQALQQRVQEGTQRTIAGIKQATAEKKAGVLERVTDQGPDLNAASDMLGTEAAGKASTKKSHTTIGAAPGGGSGFGGGGGGGSGGGGGGSGGGGRGGSGGGSGGSRVGTFTNPKGKTGKGSACGYIKTWGCTLPDGTKWPKNASNPGFASGSSSTGKSKIVGKTKKA